ncbi:unnamed protein product [Ixodes pacificus]
MVSAPDEDRQLAYLQIRSLVIGGKTHEVTTHMATPSDSTRIVVPKAFSFEGTEDAEDILLSCIEQNPQWQVLSARPMGKSRALLVTIRGKRIPTYFNFNGFTLTCSRTERESRRASTVDELVIGPTCVPCHPKAGATAAEPNTRRKTKMALTTSASPCLPSAGAGASRPPKNAHIAMFAALRVAERRRRNLRSKDGGPAGQRPRRFQESKCLEESHAKGRLDGVGVCICGRC